MELPYEDNGSWGWCIAERRGGMATAVVKAEQAEVTACKCGKPVTFEAVPCGCRLACDKCAMKLASGGKCRHCKEWYGGLRRISGGVPSHER